MKHLLLNLKNIVLFIRDLIKAKRTVNRHYLFHLLSVLLLKLCAGIDFTFGLPTIRPIENLRSPFMWTYL